MMPLIVLSAFFWISCVNFIDSSIFEHIQVELADDGKIKFNDPLHDSIPLEILYNVHEVSGKSEYSNNCSKDTNEYCYQYPNDTYLVVYKLNDTCQTLNYSSITTKPLTATINIENLLLYGGSEHMYSLWPIDKLKFERNSYVTKVDFFQAILEPYWLTSTGYYIYVDIEVPLFISVDPKQRTFQLIAEKTYPYVRRNPKTLLNFVVCKFENPRVAHEHAIDHFLGKPTSIPDINRVILPIWSTWVKYKENIDENVVFNYTKQIADNGYSGQIEIDDHWEQCYGSLKPDPKKFPDLKQLVRKMKNLNFRVTIWVHPFVNTDCEPVHSFGLKNGYFVKNDANSTTINWWRGNASYVDFTNPQASNWFKQRLDELRNDYDIDSFKFDGGESGYSPEDARYYVMDEEYPETIVKKYVKMISEQGTNVHTRVARGTQRYPIFVTMMDRDSNWSSYLGLPTLVTQLLQMNIIGYSFVLPDMIGGNFYKVKADAELFIRWLQANVFMPSLQFSVTPWDYPEYAEVARKFIELHTQYSGRIIELMKEHVRTGAPVNPPIWWIAPNDREALICDSEFLLGEDILVAPILTEGARNRDIYLPSGIWRDKNNQVDDIIQGPIWLRNYVAGLSVLPYFERIIQNDISTLEISSHSETATFNMLMLIQIITFIVIGLIIYLVCTKYFRLRNSLFRLYRRI